MKTVTLFTTKKAALLAVGSLSDTSKMPGKSWGINADRCKTGFKLAKVAGSICSICYAQKGFYAEAERAYDKAKALKGDDLLLTYNLAALYAQWGRKADAIENLKLALKADRVKVSGWLKADPMFEALEGEADFEALR